jgi:tRNA-dihydrouridine synthase A
MALRPVQPADRRFSVAPMMDRTDRHCRVLMRLLSRRALLYSEMVTTGAIRFGDVHRHLRFDAMEHPIALQLGGSDPAELAHSSRVAESYGYGEVNLNVGCPSDRVQNGRFGACLMGEPALVADCIKAMQDATVLPVTVKSRIGIDNQDSYDQFRTFIDTVAATGCSVFIVHARKAILKGLSPKENREIPPLHYEFVERLKAERPELNISLNGGLNTLDESVPHLAWADGVMLGRAAYNNIALLADVDRVIYGDPAPSPDRFAVLESYIAYMAREMAAGEPFWAMARHAINLFQGLPGARGWRRHLSETGARRDAGIDVMYRALDHVTEPRYLAAS